MNVNKSLFKDVYDAAAEVAKKHPETNILELSEYMLYMAIWMSKRFALGKAEQFLAAEHLDNHWQHLLTIPVPLWLEEK